jgi:hypothetical protein
MQTLSRFEKRRLLTTDGNVKGYNDNVADDDEEGGEKKKRLPAERSLR